MNIDSRFIVNSVKGIKKTAYDLIAKSFGIAGNFRTYDYYKAKKSAVYLEPIRIFTDFETTKNDQPTKPIAEIVKPRTEEVKPKSSKKTDKK